MQNLLVEDNEELKKTKWLCEQCLDMNRDMMCMIHHPHMNKYMWFYFNRGNLSFTLENVRKKNNV